MNNTEDTGGSSGWQPHRRLRASGGYRKLRSFRVATLIYDGTVAFCDRWIDKRSRTHDQMVQAARSGRQNIAEGSRSAATSSQTELRLTNVARSSLEELLLDYQDFLRQHRLPQWGKNDPPALAVRAVRMIEAGTRHRTDRTDRTDPPSDQSDQSDPSDQSAEDYALYAPWLDSKDPAVVANALICLLNQANYLLDQQIAALESQFVTDGGYSECLAAARMQHRNQQKDVRKGPVCPLCGKPMALRTARKGKNAGSQFWGCSGYPGCRGARKLA